MWKIVFPRKLFKELNEFLFSTAPMENGCFLSAGHYVTKRGESVLTVTDILKPSEESWNRMGEHALEPRSSYINQCTVTADSKGQGLIFVHTHPNSLHPAGFSPVDKESNERIFANLSQILDNRPLGSLVFSKHGIAGVAYRDGDIEPISSYALAGSLLTQNSMVVKGKSIEQKTDKASEVFDRQVKAIGVASQRKLQDLNVAIVGAGGTGSAVAVQLARMGIRKLTLIDNDKLDLSNLSRVYGSESGDVGRFKVEVLKKHIKTFSHTNVESIAADVTTTGPKNQALPELITSDIIFGCTDNLASRSVLNDISIQYFIPLIDIGCRIDLDKSGAINQAAIKIQVVTPDHACLWCTGTLDGRLILQETFSDEEKRKLEQEGYYQGVAKQPSIVSLTTIAASLGVNKLLSLLGAYGEDYSSKTQIELKNGFMIDESPPIKSECVCQKRRGKGDARTIV